jgi:hypothetical protein
VGEMVDFAVPTEACLLFEKKSGRRLGGGSKQ